MVRNDAFALNEANHLFSDHATYTNALGRFGIGAMVVISLLIPCDSVAVEQGHASYLPLFTLPALMAAMFSNPRGDVRGRRLEVALFLLTLAVFIATVATVDKGNVRFAINELWIWVSILAAFAASRRVVISAKHRRSMVILLVIVIGSMAVHAFHQRFVTHPETVRQYLLNPESALRDVGLDAPEGSALRYQYEGRLFTAESMATFNLSTSAAVILLMGFAMSSTVLLENCRFLKANRSGETTMHAVGKPSGASARPLVFKRIALDSIRWLLLCLLCLCGIWTTGSRTVGVLAVGLICIFLTFLCLSKFAASGLRFVVRYACLLAVCVWFGGTIVGALVPKFPGILANFPLSIQFRFHYWSATFGMLSEHPWIGAGPGNFQSLYARYKDASMSEMIADPHNLIMESAGAAGVFGLVLCIVVICFVASLWRVTMRLPSTDGSSTDLADRTHSASAAGSLTSVENSGVDGWMIAGAILSAFFAFTVGAIFGVAPDWEPYVLGTPLIAALLLVGSTWDGQHAWPRNAAWAGCFSVLLALLFSGGWTTPGIAIPLWCLLGCLTNACGIESERTSRQLIDANPDCPVDEPRKFEQIAGCLVPLSLLFLFITTTLTPQMQASILQQQAIDQFERGNTVGGLARLQQALETDRWNAIGAKQAFDLQTRILMNSGDYSERRQWLESLDTLLRRDPNNPRTWQQITEAYVTVYQRSGLSSDLQQAYRSVLEALNRDPTSIQLHAQGAIIAESLQMSAESDRLWSRAEALSKQNQNTESRWDFLFVLPARVARNADAAPASISIDEAWANRKSRLSVTED
ncbi:MAG: O-antigen ligase family protein [Pirellulaceae bacterium]